MNSDGGWEFAESTELTFHGLPDPLRDLMPAAVNATFTADRGEVCLSADRVLEPLELDIPDIEVGAARVALGKTLFDASNLSVRLGSDLELTVDLGLGLPQEPNNVFGVKDDGQPSVDFFQTYDPARPDETQVRLRLAVGSSGVGATLVTSPLQAIRLVEEDGHAFFYCDLGDFGEVKLQVPVFGLKGVSFEASGGFEVVRPLRLPLTPLKLLLAGTGAAEVLPDSLPLREVHLVDEHGSFRVEELVAMLETCGGELPHEFREGLDRVGQRLDRLPDGLKQYLVVEIPESFHFDVSLQAAGVRLDVGVDEGDPPVRLLFPGMVGPLPGLNGIELHNLAFGSLGGGALFQLEVDARIDQFDVATLAASLLLPEDGNIPLPDSRTLHRRIVLDKLYMIVVYQTIVPIDGPETARSELESQLREAQAALADFLTSKDT